MKTVYFKDPTKENIEAAAKIIRDGGLLAIPTETVYGLGADALNEDAVLRIFLPAHTPPAGHLRSTAQATNCRAHG